VEPARGPFVSYCKERHLGDKHWKRGWQFWKPGGEAHSGQSIAVFEAGAKAFCDVLRRHGLNAHWASRLD
jgi:hypothetical protein